MLQRCGHASILQKDGSSLQRHTLVPGPSPAKLGASQLSPAVTAPLHQGQIISGGQEGMGTCPGLAPVAASMTSRSPPRGTETPKWGAGLSWAPPRQEMNLQQVCSGCWSWKEPAWFLAPQVLVGTLVAQIQTKRLLSSQVSNPFSIYGQFPFHTSQSHISPDFCWDFASPCSQDLPGAAHGSNLLGSSTLCPLSGELLATLPTCVPLPFISSLPILFLLCSGSCSLSIFSPIVTSLLPAAEFPSCFSHTRSTP